MGGNRFLYKTPNQAYQLLEDKVLLKLDWAKNQKTKSSLKKIIAFANEGSSNPDRDKIMARIYPMTIKMDAQYKELQSRAKEPTPDLDDDDMPMSQPPTDLELKPLPDNLEYVFLEEPSFLPVIISSQLSKEKKNKLIYVLKKHKQAFAWKTTDIPGICPSFCKHKIQLLDDKKPVVQKQRRLNPNMQEVVKKEIIKLLDTGIIYPITDSPWVSPIHCVPKKGGITVVTNENDELVPTRTVMGWRVCIDYRKLNEATAKDHFPLPFMDQMLERLAGNKYFCFLDGFSGYFQIPIDPNDQEKTTFTCPFGTYAYRRMPFGLCNAPATFQRCILAIFHDMIEESVEAHLVLNWAKCHFMVKEGIVLGHKVSSARLEVDKAKIDVISKLPPLTNIKDTPFKFDDKCQKAFESLKEKLTCAPVIVSLNWNLPFELMCDASDFAVGSVLEFDIEIKDRKGTENVAADHLSRIENDETSDDSEVDDNFPGETLMEINTKDKPWFAYFANYLVDNIIPKGMTYQQKNKFFSDLKHFFWEQHYLFKVCSDSMIRRCISRPETRTILDKCHHGPTGGHYGPNVTAKKVLDSGFYWPTIIKEAHTLVRLCEACQKTGNISKRDEMPLNNIQSLLITYLNEPKLKLYQPMMPEYGVNHCFSTSYHPQTTSQVENTNRALKRILEKTIKDNPAIWSRKLDDALWAFRTAYKTPTGTTPYKLIYGKNCHLPFEIEHRAYWALKNCNPYLIAAGEKRMF
ncbi:reverse transcriptase domain-containing protein [Tanacetum coccineum]|uniref:Reverse transcriptase domain-containing protein n=1 Tax=Tanacetum coccineum TaxID=301880 RepID=A0ABQ5BXP9_9ASTR